MGTSDAPDDDRPARSLAAELRRRQVFHSLFAKPSEPLRFDRFVLLELVGAGGMGELYLAHDDALDRKVALKLVRGGRNLAGAEDRLLREAQALAKISHPNVVPVYQAGRVEGQVYVAMEYVRGRTLAVWLDELREPAGKARVDMILRVFSAAGRGLAAVHAAGLAHRDFKPDNVLIGDDERVRVVDFGLARALDAEPDRIDARESSSPSLVDGDDTHELERSNVGLTATGTVMGTPRYMAPEQWQGRRGDASSDQFSFCVALYEALYGVRPFDGHTRVGLARAVVGGLPVEPPRRPELPSTLRAAILRGLAVEPRERFATLDELLVILEHTLAPPRSRVGVLALVGGLALAAASTAMLLVDRPAPLDIDTGTVQHELDAARHLVAVETRMHELDALGQAEAAAQAFAAFAHAPEHAGTHALARGWLREAERRADAGDHEGSRAALVEAHLDSSEPEQRAALVGLAEHFAAQGRESELAATLATLRSVALELGPAAPALASTQQQLELHDAIRRRELGHARTLVEQPELQRYAPLVREFGHGRVSSHRVPALWSSVSSLPGLDLDADGRGELIVLPHAAERVLVLAATPELTQLAELEPAALGFATRPDHVVGLAPGPSLADAPSYVVARAGREFSLVELRSEAGRVHAELRHHWTRELATPTHWTLADLDRALGVELIGAESTGQQVIRVASAGGGGWRLDELDPATYATRSVLNGVLAGDLDGDGRDELVVAASEWSAYDVRVLQLDPVQPDRVQLVARLKLGTLSGLALLPDPDGRRVRIGVMVSPRYPNHRMFPADAPAGLPEGYYQLRWSGRGEPLEIVDWVPDARDAHAVHVGDVDGDGRLDLALASTHAGWSTTLLHGRDAGRFEALRIAGLHAVAVAQLDADADAELLMVAVDEESPPSGPLVVVGGGPPSELFAQPASELPEPPAIPRELDTTLARRWMRAEQLAAIGLVHAAASALEQLATLAAPEPAEQARMRAAMLLEPLSRPAANALDERAGSAASLARALERHADDLAYDEALRVGARLLAEQREALSDTEHQALLVRLDELRRLADPPGRRVFEFDEPLDDGWRISSELALRRDPGALRIETLGHEGQRELVRRPLVWTGGEVEVEVELELERLEWGAGIHVELRPLAPDDTTQRPLALGVEAWGGSGTYELGFLGISDTHTPSTLGLPLAHPSAELPRERRRFRLGLRIEPSRDRLWTTLAGPGVAARVAHPLGSRTPGRYELIVQTTGRPWVRGLAHLDRLVLRGLDDDPAAPPPNARERVLLALAEGSPERALELLALAGLPPRDAARIELLALDELGHFDAAAQRLDAASEHCADDATTHALIGLLLLARPDRFGPALRELCPAPLLYDTAWIASETILQQHPEVGDVPRTLTTQLLGLERASPRSLAEALTIMRLLRFRAQGWAQQDAAAARRADLRRAIELGHAQVELLEPEARRGELATRLVAELSHARRELALALIERGELDAAIAQLDAALQVSPTPELVADRIVAVPGFAVLLGREAWRQRLERHRSGRGRL